MVQGQKTNALAQADATVDLSLSSFDHSIQAPQGAREFDYDLLTEGVELDRSEIVQSLNFNRNFCTQMQSYMIGTGDATPPDQYASKVRQDAFDLGLRVVLETKNAYVSQLAARGLATFASENSADPRDIGIDRGALAQTVESETMIANFNRIRENRNKYIESQGYAQAA